MVDSKTNARLLLILKYAILSLIAIILLGPLLWVVMSSFRPTADIFKYSGRISWETFIPQTFTLEHYYELAKTDFVRAVQNSLFVASSTVIIGIFINSLAGFAFAVFDFPFKKILFVFVLASFMMPFESMVIPLYILMRTLGWTDTYRALILPEVANGLVIFLFRQFFSTIPKEIIEAARVDGASWFNIYLRIMMPLSWPIAATAALTLFILQWDAFFWPLVAASKPDFMMVQVAIVRNMTMEDVSWGEMFASATAAIVVAMIPFFILQRYYVRTIVQGSLK